jgi:glycerol kinase
MQSILEGIVFRAAEVIVAMNEFITIKNEISIDGGVTANPYFCQFLADVLNRRIIVQSLAELTAFGTAKLTAGNNIDQKMRDSLARQYQPETDRRQYLEKFKDAVTRSIEWRS